MEALQPEFLDPDYCSSWVEVALDVFVVVKAAVLLYYSSQGILWFWRSNFTAITVIFILFVSMGLVVSEMAYRFTHRSLRYRFIQNSLSQWQVFACMTVMMAFARKNDSASANIKIRGIFIPTHFLFFSLLLWGSLSENVAHCSGVTKYPFVFIFQYTLFFAVYFMFLYLKSKDFYMDWHPTIRDIDYTKENAADDLDTDARRRLKVRIIFESQTERFKCFFNWLVFLTCLCLFFVAYQFKKDGGTKVGCALDGDHWLFADCSARFIIQFLHVFTTMQCAAMARVVFVKTVKKVNQTQSFVSLKTRMPAQINDDDEFQPEGQRRQGRQLIVHVGSDETDDYPRGSLTDSFRSDSSGV